MSRITTIAFAASVFMASAAMAQTPMHATPPEPFKFLSAKDVTALTDKAGPGAKTAFLGDHENHFVEYATRNDTGNEAEVHTHWTHYIHILSGEGSLTYGGTVSHPRETGPGQVRGSGITGGTTIPVHAGDYVQIPAGMPHLFGIAAGHKLHYL
ncbi:MAG TPA: hypothetical protein VHV26_16370, partial [Rhizomicrobium sp.]|nr:hypothetical protein [Rhizomicrobium sp.]